MRLGSSQTPTVPSFCCKHDLDFLKCLILKFMILAKTNLVVRKNSKISTLCGSNGVEEEGKE